MPAVMVSVPVDLRSLPVVPNYGNEKGKGISKGMFIYCGCCPSQATYSTCTRSSDCTCTCTGTWNTLALLPRQFAYMYVAYEART